MALRLGQTFAPQFEKTFETVKQARAIKFNEKEGQKIIYESTQDNCVATYGKLIKSVSELMIADGKTQ